MRYCPDPECPHRQATGSPAEYRDEIDVCADCGSTLDLQPPAPEGWPAAGEGATGPLSSIRWVPLPGFQDTALKELGRAILEDEDIPCVVSDAGLLVPSDRLEEARAVLARDRSDQLEAAGAFTDDEDITRCPRCTSSGITRERGRLCMACGHRW